MALTFDQACELERLDVDNVRERLRYAGASATSVVPGLGDGKMRRARRERPCGRTAAKQGYHLASSNVGHGLPLGTQLTAGSGCIGSARRRSEEHTSELQ